MSGNLLLDLLTQINEGGAQENVALLGIKATELGDMELKVDPIDAKSLFFYMNLGWG